MQRIYIFQAILYDHLPKHVYEQTMKSYMRIFIMIYMGKAITYRSVSIRIYVGKSIWRSMGVGIRLYVGKATRIYSGVSIKRGQIQTKAYKQFHKNFYAQGHKSLYAQGHKNPGRHIRKYLHDQIYKNKKDNSVRMYRIFAFHVAVGNGPHEIYGDHRWPQLSRNQKEHTTGNCFLKIYL